MYAYGDGVSAILTGRGLCFVTESQEAAEDKRRPGGVCGRGHIRVGHPQSQCLRKRHLEVQDADHPPVDGSQSECIKLDDQRHDCSIDCRKVPLDER